MRTSHKLKKNKGKRWQKGQSSSSNPASKKFREQAKSGFFNPGNAGKGPLTTNALQHHNVMQSELVDSTKADEDFDSQSIGALTQKTYASNWSDCTNPCFNRLLNNWVANSEIHKEMLAILAAITEIIKSKHGKETETEYFAALMTTLSTVDSADSLSAVVSLLHMTMKRLPKSILKAKFSEISKELIEVLNNPEYADNGLLLRSLLGCLSQLLRVQEAAIWTLSSTIHILNTLLHYIIHPKPKVRKIAQHTICSILKGSDFITESHTDNVNSYKLHPGAPTISKYCINAIEKCGSKDSTTLLHVLQLLKDILITFPPSNLKTCCETLLKVMTLGTSLVKSCALQAFHGMFVQSSQSPALTSQLNAQIINALYDFQPSLNDAQPLIAWLSVMKEAHLSLNRLDSDLTISHLPRLFACSVQCLLSEKTEVHGITSDCLKILMIECVKPRIPDVSEKKCPKMSSLASNLLQIFENGLKYQFHLAWKYVLDLIADYFKIFGKCYPSIMGNVLISLANLRDSYRFGFVSSLDNALGFAIKAMGPKIVLKSLPLSLDSNESIAEKFPRSWLLPVLRNNIQNTELEFFVSHFLPIARALFTKSEERKKNNKIGEAKTLDILQSQIWSLLPGFCNKPTDLKECFKGVARMFGNLLNERPDLLMTILSALRNLIKSSVEKEQDKEEMKKFSKNYLPIFFNLYTSPVEQKGSVDEGNRLAVYETLKLYLEITDIQLIETLFDKTLEKQKGELDNFTRHAIMDLMRAMLYQLDEDRISSLYNVCVPFLRHADLTVQKKSYRILEEICGSDSEGCAHFVKNKLELIQKTLAKSLSSTAPSSKAPRLRCLYYVMQKLEESNFDFIQMIVPEVILCTKHGSEKSKRAAFDLVVEIGKTMMKWEHKPKPEILKDFIQLILAGFAGSPQMVSSSILALSSVIHFFKDYIDHDLLKLLIQNMCLLMTSPTREVVQSTLSFIKVLFSILNQTQLAQYLDMLMQGLCDMTDDARNHFRVKVREILERLVRKFGYDMILKMIPAQYEKVLKNMRKIQALKERNKVGVGEPKNESRRERNKKSSAEEFDDILEEFDDDNANESKESRRNSAWIQESGEIVDFLDPKASRNISTTNPTTRKSNKQEDNFKTTSDGRWIITEQEDESKSKPTKAMKRKADDLMNDDEGFDDAETPTQSKYEAGGRGIHRNVNKSNKLEVDSNIEKKPKKGSGDIKNKSGVDPYMYIPLNKQALNKRKQKKYKGHMDNLLEGAKRGAEKGKKGRKKIKTNR